MTSQKCICVHQYLSVAKVDLFLLGVAKKEGPGRDTRAFAC
jgi:hypothetical protein